MADRADDGFDRYYTEKIWDLVPSIHRHEDGIAERPGVLRAIVEIIGAQAAALRRSQDRLWDDEFIDLCDEWAVPYLGDLVGARMVSALNLRGRRVDVAKTVYYRRRKGTIRVLEELISDIAGWEGKVAESFRRLARVRHGLDAAPGGLEGRWSGTPPGGWADLRDVRAATLVDGPFDEYAHTPDVRRARGTDGLYNIPRVLFFLYRLPALEVEGVTPFARGDGVSFTFDPSGRDAPLFVPRRRLEDWDEWTSALPWELPAPMSCRLLNHAEYVITEALIQDMEALGLTPGAAAALRALTGLRFRGEERLRDHLSTSLSAPELLSASNYDRILAGAIVDACGKSALLPKAITVAPDGVTPIVPAHIVAGNLATFGLMAAGKELVIDPERGRLKLLGAPPAAAQIRVSYWYGFGGDVGAGTYDRSDSVRPPPKTLVPAATPVSGQISIAGAPVDGVWEIVDSATYGPIDDVSGVVDLSLQAADRERPYVKLAADWVITASGDERTLTLDGIWFGATGPFAIVLRGSWSRVTISHCTLDPGGVDVDNNPIHPVRLFVEGKVDRLVIERSIVAPITTRASGLIDEVAVIDSILQSTIAATPALAFTPGKAVLRRSTVLRSPDAEPPLSPLQSLVDVNRLDASEALIAGGVEVTDTQNGCFRFSAAQAGSRIPRPYRSVSLTDWSSLFVSRRFGDPGFAQLGESAPVDLVRGAENGGEIGAFSSELNPIKLDSLARKVEEYLPFGLVPCFIRRT
ncbi:hypothetical protein [Sorangium sp. So ce1097]|uniref:hypothetical protein n=1 Tax=Sorangium sp. So ce1097 TaxID=3133330 RepID=UPI003F646E84